MKHEVAGEALYGRQVSIACRSTASGNRSIGEVGPKWTVEPASCCMAAFHEAVAQAWRSEILVEMLAIGRSLSSPLRYAHMYDVLVAARSFSFST